MPHYADVAGFPNRFLYFIRAYFSVALQPPTNGHICSLMIINVHVILTMYLLSKYTNSDKSFKSNHQSQSTMPTQSKYNPRVYLTVFFFAWGPQALLLKRSEGNVERSRAARQFFGGSNHKAAQYSTMHMLFYTLDSAS